MVDFAEHRKALLCNDAQSIADYESSNGVRRLKRSQHGCKMTKCIQVESIKELREAISFAPSKQGLGSTPNRLSVMVELFLNKSLKVHHPHSLAHLHCPTMVTSQIAESLD